MSAWPPATFLVAFDSGPQPRAGYSQNGLGLFIEIAGTKKKPPVWSLNHIGSGHCLCLLTGDVRKVFPIASDISDLGDWTFLGLEGWKNQLPGAPELLIEVLKRHGIKSLGTLKVGRNYEIAQKIAQTI